MRCFADTITKGVFVSMPMPGQDEALVKAQLRQVSALVGDEVAKAQVIVADNVAEYMYAVSDREYWHASDFPCLAPPFGTMFIEFRRPSRVLSGPRVLDSRLLPERWGVLIRAVDPEHYVEEQTRRHIQRLEQDFSFQAGETAAKQRVYRLHVLLQQGTSFNSLPWEDRMLAQCYEDYQQALTAHNWEHVREHYRWYVADAKWVLSCLLVFKASEWVADLRFQRKDVLERALIVPPLFVHVGVKADGTPSRITDGDCHTITAAAYGFDMGGWSQKVTRLVRTSMEQCEFLFKPAMMAISLMHCRNVSLRNAVLPPKWVKAYRKRHGADPRDYSVIDVPQFREVLDTNGRLRASLADSPMRLHQVRGHFKTYTEESPLFGRIVGRFFWSQHTRGQEQAGVSKQIYRATAPEKAA